MPFDPIIADTLNANLLTNHQSGTQLTTVLDRNLTQGLGSIHNMVIQSVAATADDAQLMASMQTASRVPAQGQTPVTP